MIKQLLKCVREYKAYALFTPVFVALEVVLEAFITRMMASLIDKGINAGNTAVIIKIGSILILFTLASMACGVLSGWASSKASAGFAKNLRHDMFHKVQTFSFSNIDKFSTSSIVTRLTSDINRIQMAFMMVIRIMLRSPLTLIFALIMSFTINAKLSLIFLVTVPVLAGGLIFISKTTHPIFHKVFRTYDKLNLIVQENLRGIRVVKNFVREDHEVEKFNKVSDSIYSGFFKAERRMSLNGPLMQFCMYTCSLLISWFGAKIIVTTNATELTTGQLTSLISYSMQILGSLMMVSMVFIMYTQARASVNRVCEVLNEEVDITSKPDAVKEVADGSIEFDNVNFSYARSDNLCLAGINLKIESGQTIGVLGGTGSSKSTLVQLIPRLYDVSSGSVKVGGVDVRDYDLTALRDSVAMVLQKNELFSGTINDNIRWGNEDATQEEIIHAAQLAQADSFIQQMPQKYETEIDQGGTNVSGGQKQRLCIARALLKKPKILILDDSTSAVDTRTDALIRRAFAEEIPNTTKIIIAQRISSVQDADKIVIMDNGVINGFGTHEDLLASNTIYREIYEFQMKLQGGETSEK